MNESVNISPELWKEILQNKEISSDPVIQILSFLFNSDGYGASGGDIAFALNYKHHAPLNRIIPDFSKRILKKYPFIEPPRRRNGTVRYWHVPFLGTDNQSGFVWILRPELAEALPQVFQDIKKDRKLTIFQEIEKLKPSYETLQETTRESVIQSRIGQGQFRTLLISYWQGCSVSGCTQFEILKASHIKPWRFSSNEERLDIFNGLLLLPNLDSCFDSGFISFEDNGKIMISNRINKTIMLILGITSNLKLSQVDEKHKAYLRFHRENIFRP
ncbi:MAG: HNH endonuclease [Anaerolineales bacterium]|nr:HNH endonuclease [Anaerolineales bacterium]